MSKKKLMNRFYKYLFILLFGVSFSLKIFGQKEVADSLFKTLQTKLPDTTRVINLVKLCEYAGWRMGKYDTALVLANEAKALAEKIKFKKGIANAYNNIANVYYFQSNYAEALKNYSSAIKLFQEIGFKKGVANVSSNMGNIQSNIGNYNEALESYYTALSVFEESGDKKLIAAMCDNIGMIYSYQKNTKESFRFLEKALALQKEINDKPGMGNSLFNIAQTNSEAKNYTKALELYTQALEIAKETNDVLNIANNYQCMGNAYSNLGNFSKALEVYVEAKKIYESINNERGIMYLYGNIGIVYGKLKKLNEASKWLNKAIELSRQANDLFQSQICYLNLAQIDSMNGDYKSAYKNYKNYVVCKDRLLNEENSKKTVQIQMQYEFDKKQLADSLKLEDERKSTAVKFKQAQQQRFVLYGGLLLVGLFGIFMFNRFRVTQKQKHVIEQKEKETHLQKQIIEEKHKEITDSINYAERIQRSLLASKQLMNQKFNNSSNDNYFIFYKPKDIVSGDFYWLSELYNNNFALVTADSTGHGVPGAIMSILNIACLNETIKENATLPNDILNKTREKIIDILKRDGSEDGGKDGMDCSLCVYDFKNMQLQIAAANNSVWIVRKINNDDLLLRAKSRSESDLGDLVPIATEIDRTDDQFKPFNSTFSIYDIKPDKMPVGKSEKQHQSFALHTVQLQKGDVIFTLTDGFADQFGGPKGKKFMSKNLRELLITNSQLPMNQQKEAIESVFKNWIGNLEQIDDVTVIGIRV